jgi:hypothetical protein
MRRRAISANGPQGHGNCDTTSAREGVGSSPRPLLATGRGRNGSRADLGQVWHETEGYFGTRPHLVLHGLPRPQCNRCHLPKGILARDPISFCTVYLALSAIDATCRRVFWHETPSRFARFTSPSVQSMPPAEGYFGTRPHLVLHGLPRPQCNRCHLNPILAPTISVSFATASNATASPPAPG